MGMGATFRQPPSPGGAPAPTVLSGWSGLVFQSQILTYAIEYFRQCHGHSGQCDDFAFHTLASLADVADRQHNSLGLYRVAGREPKPGAA